MDLTTFVYEKILSKMQYDIEREQYVIRLTDYQHLNISNEQFRILKQICYQKGIYLEYTNEPIPVIEDKELFQEYNKIKEKLLLEPNNQQLENRRIEIRNKIAMQNFKAVRTLLNRRITGLPQMKDKEDIYQIGYQCLIEFIDSYDITKGKVLTTAINKYLIYHINRKIIAYQKNITNYTNKCMDAVNKTKEQERINDTSFKELSKLTNIPEYHIKSLRNLDDILTPISIEEELESIKENNESENSPLYDDTFESNIHNQMVKDMIMKVINTLPSQQKEIIIQYFGLDGEESHNIIELGKMHGISKERINEIRKEALTNLRNSIRTKYLIDSYDSDRPYQEIEILSSEKHLKSLEERLIKLLIQECSLNLLDILSSIKREILELKLGLKDNNCYSIGEISKILDISYFKTSINKEDALKILKITILKEYYHIEQPNTITYETYLDYLMKLYLTRTNNLIKTK